VVYVIWCAHLDFRWIEDLTLNMTHIWFLDGSHSHMVASYGVHIRERCSGNITVIIVVHICGRDSAVVSKPDSQSRESQ